MAPLEGMPKLIIGSSLLLDFLNVESNRVTSYFSFYGNNPSLNDLNRNGLMKGKRVVVDKLLFKYLH